MGTVAGHFPSKGDKITLELVRFNRYFKVTRGAISGVSEYCNCIRHAEEQGWHTKTVFYGTHAVLAIYPRFWDIAKRKLDALFLEHDKVRTA